MDDILELVLEVWLLTLRLFPFGPVQGPRDARPDTPRDKRTQYILRPALWTVLAGGTATGCAIGVGWVRLVCAPALGLFITSLSWLAMRWLLWLWHGGAEQARARKGEGKFIGGAALAVVRRPRRSGGGAHRLCGRLGAAQRCRHRPERGGADWRRPGPFPAGGVAEEDG